MFLAYNKTNEFWNIAFLQENEKVFAMFPPQITPMANFFSVNFFCHSIWYQWLNNCTEFLVELYGNLQLVSNVKNMAYVI